MTDTPLVYCFLVTGREAKVCDRARVKCTGQIFPTNVLRACHSNRKNEEYASVCLVSHGFYVDVKHITVLYAAF